MNGDAAARQREQLQRELEQHRRRIDELLSPAEPLPARLARVQGDGFPRSQTMRLLLGEPLLLAALSALAMRLLGGRTVRLLPVAIAVAKTAVAVLRPSLHAAPGPTPETRLPPGDSR